jgi:predicted aspartyl protease
VAWLLALLVLAGSVPARADVPAEAVLADLPFLETQEKNRIYLDLAPAGSARPLRVLLDTGANVSLMTPGAAKAAGVRVRRTKSDPYRRKTVLGRDLQFLVDSRYTDTASRTGWEYGLLGGDFLAEYVVELDFAGRRVRFLDRDRYQVPESASGEGEAVLPITVVSNRPGLRLEVNGRELEMLLDTGMPWALMLSGELARASSVESVSDARFGMGSVMGPVEAEVGEAKQVKLGPFVFENVPVAVAPKGWFNIGYPGDSMIACDLLAQFVVRIDYEGRRLWLQRRPDAVFMPLVEAAEEQAEVPQAEPR